MTSFSKIGTDGHLDQLLLELVPVRIPGVDYFPEAFVSGQRQENVPALEIRPSQPGPMRDLNWIWSPPIPIVTERVVSVIDEMSPGAVQWFPVTVRGHYEGPPLFLLNALHVVDCIDIGESIWSGGRDGPGPSPGDRVPQILRLREDVDPPADIFRVKTLELVAIITRRLRIALENNVFIGWSFTGV